jgi:ectoine hydroxylase-related dioxygenase (phytanoyl-CoA dioxygenase family)
VRQFNENGYVNMGRVVDDAGCERLRDEMLRVADGDYERPPVHIRNLGPDERAPVLQIVNIWQSSPAFLEHVAIPEITEAVAQLSGDDLLRVWHDQVQSKPEKAGCPTTWHQDWPLWPIIEPANLISAWVPFQDATIENGCMWMVPGSHLWGDQQAYLDTAEHFQPTHNDPSRLPEGARLDAVPVEVKKGECHLHHCLTWHGSRANRTDGMRAAMAVHYMPADTRYVKRGTHVMEQYVEVEEGSILSGAAFPIVYQRAAPTAP